MDYLTWLSKEQPDNGNGCFKTPNEIKCEDKFCNGSECKKYLEYRLRFLNDELPNAKEYHRKQHLISSIEKCESKLREL